MADTNLHQSSVRTIEGHYDGTTGKLNTLLSQVNLDEVEGDFTERDVVETNEMQHVQERTTDKIVTNSEERTKRGEDEKDSVAKVIAVFLLEKVPEFGKLCELRKKGWESEEGDRHWDEQRQTADNADPETSKMFYRLMQRNGQDLHKETGAFSIITSSRSTPTGILDFGAAPGGFLSVALEVNPRARALAITLPLSCGGYPVNLPSRPNLTVKFMDVTMLAADMGATEIPSSHPDAANFLSRVFTPDSRPFNLIICGGSVVRAHTRASYRERREASRLICSQLAIGMDHIQNSGTMVVLLHKIERWKNIQLIRRLSRFATIQLCKPKNCHTTRSSVYLVASDVQPSHPEAIAAVDHWKRMWSVATFGTDEQYQSFGKKDKETVEDILREFGEEFVRLGKRAWAIQAAALERQTWTN